MRLWIVGAIGIGLLGIAPAATEAQTEPTISSATHVTGRLVTMRYDDADETGGTADSFGHMRSLVQIQRVAWSDPRLPSQKRTVINIDGYMLESREGVLPFTGSHRLEGPTGSWSGTQQGVLHANGSFWQDVLVGEGAYRGLYAVLDGRMEFSGDGTGVTVWEGYIFEGGMPPMPDPVPAGSLDRQERPTCERCA